MPRHSRNSHSNKGKKRRGYRKSPQNHSDFNFNLLGQSGFDFERPSHLQIGPGYRPRSNFRKPVDFNLNASRYERKKQLNREREELFSGAYKKPLDLLRRRRKLKLEGLKYPDEIKKEYGIRKRRRNGDGYGDFSHGGVKKRKISEEEELVVKAPFDPQEEWSKLGTDQIVIRYKLKPENGVEHAQKQATINKEQKNCLKGPTVKNLNFLKSKMEDELDRFQYIRWFKNGKGPKNTIYEASKGNSIDSKWVNFIDYTLHRHSNAKVDTRKASASLADQEFKDSGLFDSIQGRNQHSSFYHNANTLSEEAREHGLEDSRMEKVLGKLDPQEPSRKHNNALLAQNVRVDAQRSNWRKWGSGKDELFMTAHTKDYLRYDSGLDPNHQVFSYKEVKTPKDGSDPYMEDKVLTYMDAQRRNRVDTDAVFWKTPKEGIPGGHTGAIKGLSSDEEKAQNGELSFKTNFQGPFHSDRHDKLLEQPNPALGVLATGAHTLEATMDPQQVSSFTNQGFFLNSKQFGDMNDPDNRDRLSQSLQLYRPTIAKRLVILCDKINALAPGTNYALPDSIYEMAEEAGDESDFQGRTLKGMIKSVWATDDNPVRKLQDMEVDH